MEYGLKDKVVLCMASAAGLGKGLLGSAGERIAVFVEIRAKHAQRWNLGKWVNKGC